MRRRKEAADRSELLQRHNIDVSGAVVFVQTYSNGVSMCQPLLPSSRVFVDLQGSEGTSIGTAVTRWQGSH